MLSQQGFLALSETYQGSYLSVTLKVLGVKGSLLSVKTQNTFNK